MRDFLDVSQIGLFESRYVFCTYLHFIRFQIYYMLDWSNDFSRKRQFKFSSILKGIIMVSVFFDIIWYNSHTFQIKLDYTPWDKCTAKFRYNFLLIVLILCSLLYRISNIFTTLPETSIQLHIQSRRRANLHFCNNIFIKEYYIFAKSSSKYSPLF